MRRELGIFVAVTLAASLSTVVRADARERVENGQITFGRFDPVLGDFSTWVANSDGTAQRRLTHVPSFFSDWSPDGRRIAFDFVDDAGEHVATISPDGTRTRQITSGTGIQEVPRWSPDGRLITFDASPVFPDDPAFHTSIWVMRADGSKPRQITTDGFDVEPVFSPDGSQIAFGRITGINPDGTQDEAIYVVNLDGTNLHEIVAPRAQLEHPDWSPDGQLVSFNIGPEIRSVPGAGSVMTVRPDGSDLRTLRAGTAEFVFFKPVWSPDGTKILVGCDHNSTHIDKICMLSADGQDLKIVIDAAPDIVNFPAWGPERNDRSGNQRDDR